MIKHFKSQRGVLISEENDDNQHTDARGLCVITRIARRPETELEDRKTRDAQR